MTAPSKMKDETLRRALSEPDTKRWLTWLLEFANNKLEPHDLPQAREELIRFCIASSPFSVAMRWKGINRITVTEEVVDDLERLLRQATVNNSVAALHDELNKALTALFPKTPPD